MHDCVRAFVAAAAETFNLPGPVFEFGSYIVAGQENIGNLRPLFPGRRYVGCDMRVGPGVDRVEDLAQLTLADGSAKSILCVETLEHVFDVHRAVEEMLRVLAPGGTIVITTPFNLHLHGHPDDYWRVTPSCLQRLLAPLDATIVGSQGDEKFPHTVLAVGCKAPTPTDFATRAQRLIAAFQGRLRGFEAAEPRGAKFKRRIVSLVRSKGERRRQRQYYQARFVTSYVARFRSPAHARVAERAELFDFHLDRVAGLQEHRRLAGRTDSRRRAGENDVARQESANL
jgi:SAM-dependent methyltransferase